MEHIGPIDIPYMYISIHLLCQYFDQIIITMVSCEMKCCKLLVCL